MKTEKLLNGLNVGKLFFDRYSSIVLTILHFITFLSVLIFWLYFAVTYVDTPLFQTSVFMIKLLQFLLVTYIVAVAFSLLLNTWIIILIRYIENKIFKRVKKHGHI
jgi:hypothetical protein